MGASPEERAGRTPEGRVATATPGRGRLRSLDVFRGLSVAGMILVNSPGSRKYVYGPLEQADWDGWTATDVIFPAFLFIVGVAIPYAFASRRDGASTRDLVARILRRSLLLFGIGLFLNFFLRWDLATLRIPGTLQRIAACYLLAALLALRLSWRGIAAAAATLLVGYWLVLAVVPAPGSAAGDVSKRGSLPSWVDRTVFGPEHIFRRSYDPEGILSTSGALATTLIGVLTGHWLRRRPEPRTTVVTLAAGGGALLVAGYAWSVILPINKPLWTSSYVLVTGGAALLLLAACYWIVDAAGFARWARPLEAFGTNAFFAFVLSQMLARVLTVTPVGGPEGAPVTLRMWLFDTLAAGPLDPFNASLAIALAQVLAMLAVVWPMYRRGILVKL